MYASVTIGQEPPLSPLLPVPLLPVPLLPVPLLPVPLLPVPLLPVPLLPVPLLPVPLLPVPLLPVPLLLVLPPPSSPMMFVPELLLHAAATASAPSAVRFTRTRPLREALKPSRRLMLLSPDSLADKACASLPFH
jgi:hypothetical protein